MADRAEQCKLHISNVLDGTQLSNKNETNRGTLKDILYLAILKEPLLTCKMHKVKLLQCAEESDLIKYGTVSMT